MYPCQAQNRTQRFAWSVCKLGVCLMTAPVRSSCSEAEAETSDIAHDPPQAVAARYRRRGERRTDRRTPAERKDGTVSKAARETAGARETAERNGRERASCPRRQAQGQPRKTKVQGQGKAGRAQASAAAVGGGEAAPAHRHVHFAPDRFSSSGSDSGSDAGAEEGGGRSLSAEAEAEDSADWCAPPHHTHTAVTQLVASESLARDDEEFIGVRATQGLVG